MSFPTKHLSSSPSLQRDYAILGNRPHQPASLGAVLHEEEEEGESSRRRTTSMDDGSSVSGDAAAAATDNMSNLSLPDEAYDAHAEEASTNNGVATAKRRPRSRPPSTHITSPYLAPSIGDRSRGNRAANLHQQHNTAIPINVRRQNAAAAAQDGGAASHPPPLGAIASSLILGGQHLMPPPDADMRSQDELDYSGTSYDDDRTPRPRSPGQGSLFRRFHSEEGANEASPLLGNSASSASAVASGVSYGGVNGVGVTPRPRRGSWALGSGWDARQPAPPDDAQLAEIAQEPAENIHRREMLVLLKFSTPIWLTHLLELSLNVVSVFSLGHLGTNELAAASLSSMTANVTGFSVLAGFISALDSILPGAYTSQPKMVGLYTQRMLVVTIYLLFPICAIWLSSEWILLHLGQEPVVAALAGQYLRVLVIGLPGYAGFEVCRRYLQAQGLMHAPTMVLFVVSPINAVLNWLFVWGPDQFRFGFIGAPLASVVSMWLMFVLGALQCYVAPRVAWGGWSMLAFTGLKPILQLGTSGTFAMCAEWWSWEIVGLVTSRLGTVALAAQSVLLVCSSISYQLPYAISVAAAVRVGNLLGASQPRYANISSDMAMILSLCAGLFNSLFFLLVRKQLGTFFSGDAEVVGLVTAVVPLMAAFQIMDGACGVAAGILRGTGRQSAGAIINLTGYYAIGIPLGLIVTFGPLQWGLSGLWGGLSVALLYASVYSYIIIRRTDWDAEVRRTLALMGSDETVAPIKPTRGDSGDDAGHVA